MVETGSQKPVSYFPQRDYPSLQCLTVRSPIPSYLALPGAPAAIRAFPIISGSELRTRPSPGSSYVHSYGKRRKFQSPSPIAQNGTKDETKPLPPTLLIPRIDRKYCRRAISKPSQAAATQPAHRIRREAHPRLPRSNVLLVFS